MALTGVAHVAFTVTDLARSKDWYSRVLDWSPVMDGSDEGVTYSLGLLPNGLLVGFRQWERGSGDTFDPMRTGLDHLSFAVGSADELAEWERRFTDLGVTYSSTQHVPYGHVLNFKDPDGIALELFAPPEESA